MSLKLLQALKKIDDHAQDSVVTVQDVIDVLAELRPDMKVTRYDITLEAERIMPPDKLLGMQYHPAPIPMLIFCPNCHKQHVDRAEPDKGWNNPDHKSHTCKVHEGGCGKIFRLADVPTTGVVCIQTKGKDDTWQNIS